MRKREEMDEALRIISNEARERAIDLTELERESDHDFIFIMGAFQALSWALKCPTPNTSPALFQELIDTLR